MPVVIRPVIDTNAGNHYVFIGECYVHTMMDGRAIAVQEHHGLKTEKFELR